MISSLVCHCLHHTIVSAILFQVIRWYSVTSYAAQVIINLQLIVDPLKKNKTGHFLLVTLFKLIVKIWRKTTAHRTPCSKTMVSNVTHDLVEQKYPFLFGSRSWVEVSLLYLIRKIWEVVLPRKKKK